MCVFESFSSQLWKQVGASTSKIDIVNQNPSQSIHHVKTFPHLIGDATKKSSAAFTSSQTDKLTSTHRNIKKDRSINNMSIKL